MKYDDLLNIPYKHGGRDKNGYDCYGLVLECCARTGQPLKDFFKDVESLKADEINNYIEKGLNVLEISKPKIGCIVEMEIKGNSHVGFLVDRNTIIHATINRGVKTSCLYAFKNCKFYEVINESNSL